MKEGIKSEFKNIILVDDDADDRDLFKEAIASIHPQAEVKTSKDGEELMEYLATVSKMPDVIFLDLNMPRKNGKECLKELRVSEQFQFTPIVIFTTSLNPVDIQETFTEGATFFMRKPNSFQELKEILHQLLYSQLHTAGERSREKFVVNRTLTIV
jgi:CheY-like chemotaxis protein